MSTFELFLELGLLSVLITSTRLASSMKHATYIAKSRVAKEQTASKRQKSNTNGRSPTLSPCHLHSR
ncbi:hypothetical protein AB395_00002866 [Sinorhizobium fredii CCBAU 45436]|nr:hypothetical protein AB395_00002866 [Sinorhizobium fredii CCBAU 45436]